MLSRRRPRRRLSYLGQYSREVPVTVVRTYSAWTIIWWLLWIIFFGAIVWGIWYSPLFRIQKVTVEGTQSIDPNALTESLNLAGSNLFRLDADRISRTLLAYPVVRSFALVRVLPHELKIEVDERGAVLLWSSNGQTWTVDATGHAVQDVSAALPTGVPTVVDTTNLSVSANQAIVPLSFIKTLAMLSDQLPTIYNETVKNYEVGETVYDLDAIMNDGRRIRFNILTDVAQQLAELKRLSTTRPDLFQKSSIDLRVDRWAYVK